MSTLGVLAVGAKAWCSFKGVSGGSGKFGDPYSTKGLSIFRSRRKPRTKRWLGDLSSEGLALPAGCAGVLFFVASAGLSGQFEVWNVILCDRCRTSYTLSSLWRGGTLRALLKLWQVMQV